MLPPPDQSRDEDGFLNRGAEVTRSEAFFDAAFAFAITLMVISIDEIPDSAEKLINALKSVPAFAASFLLIVLFWRGHADWTRRYGLNDRYSQRLSLMLVFIVLVFIYPLRMVFGSFFGFATAGWLPTQVNLNTIDDFRLMFVVFALGFGAMGVCMVLLYRHAWSHREILALDSVERLFTWYSLLRWAMLPVFSTISLGISAFLLREGTTNSLVISLPGTVFFVLSVVNWTMNLRLQRACKALQRA